ncbi:MAG: NUDIX domain-containing protein [Croceimicrobium sp.]
MDKIVVSGVIGDRDESLEKVLNDAGIGENFTADMMREYLSQNTEGDINIEVDTIGGDVAQGFEIFDMLQAEKAKGRIVKTYGKQFDSIGSIIFLAGSDGHRYAYKNANPLIHNSWREAESLSGIPLNSQTLREIAEGHDEADYQMMHEYLKVSGRDRKAEVQELMISEAQLTDKQLLDLNFASEIITAPAAIRGAAIRAMAFTKIKAEAPQQYADSILINEGKVLLIQRALDDDFEGGKWAFPGGKIEGGELPEIAAARELFEEVGLQALDVQPIEVIKHENGSASHFYYVQCSGLDLELEEGEIARGEWFSIEDIPQEIIKDQRDQYTDLIKKALEMSDKVTALEKGMNAISAKINALFGTKAMLVPLKGGEGEIFVYSEDGEFEGKRAVIASEGEPTDENAPAGTHELNDGRSITVGEGGVIESVQESAEAMKEEEMQAMTEELEAAKTEIEALKAAKVELEKSNEAAKVELLAEMKAMKAEIAEMKKVVPGDDSKEKSIENVKALKKQQEEFKKLKPSERRLLALKLEANK